MRISTDQTKKRNIYPKFPSETAFVNLTVSFAILIVENQPVLLEKMSLTIEKSHSKSKFFAKFRLRDNQSAKHIPEHNHRVTLNTDKNVQWDLGGKSPFGSFGDRWVDISRWITGICKFWNYYLINFPLRAIQFRASFLKKSELKNFGLTSSWRNARGNCEQIISKTRKQKTYTKFWHF